MLRIIDGERSPQATHRRINDLRARLKRVHPELAKIIEFESLPHECQSLIAECLELANVNLPAISKARLQILGSRKAAWADIFTQGFQQRPVPAITWSAYLHMNDSDESNIARMRACLGALAMLAE